jgi:hypothetical protein
MTNCNETYAVTLNLIKRLIVGSFNLIFNGHQAQALQELLYFNRTQSWIKFGA